MGTRHTNRCSAAQPDQLQVGPTGGGGRVAAWGAAWGTAATSWNPSSIADTHQCQTGRIPAMRSQGCS